MVSVLTCSRLLCQPPYSISKLPFHKLDDHLCHSLFLLPSQPVDGVYCVIHLVCPQWSRFITSPLIFSFSLSFMPFGLRFHTCCISHVHQIFLWGPGFLVCNFLFQLRHFTFTFFEFCSVELQHHSQATNHCAVGSDTTSSKFLSCRSNLEPRVLMAVSMVSKEESSFGFRHLHIWNLLVGDVTGESSTSWKPCLCTPAFVASIV